MRMKDKEQSTKTMKLTPSVHADLIGLARYGDSLSDVVERLIDFYKKNHKGDQK
jgi:predicted CopG family antitoxin